MADTKKLLTDLLDKEIAWCATAGAYGPTADYRSGFMAGLKQARFLIRKALALIGEEEGK